MRYLLQERFLGACLGGVMATISPQQTKTLPNKLENNQFFWLEIYQEIMNQIPLDLSQSLSWENLSLNSMSKITISELARFAFPLILSYHDNLHQLKFFFHQSAQYWKIPTIDLNGLLLWTTVVCSILKEKLKPEDLPQQITSTYREFRPSLSQDFLSLESLLYKGLSMTEITAELSLLVNPHDLPFLLSLYCFYQTPEDFGLTIKQAIKVEYVSSDLVALTGFLSGAYNSRIGLPINWDKFWQNRDDYQKIWKLGRRIFTLWSGVSDLGNNVNMAAIVATPRTLQNRSQLTIISQAEYESN